MATQLAPPASHVLRTSGSSQNTTLRGSMSPSQQRVRAPDRPDYTPYVPRGLLRRYVMSPVPITQPRIRTLDNAVVAFFDISGFTRLTEKFGKLGPRGSETVRDILSNFFTQLVHIIDRFGGDVMKFAGDAVFVLFDRSYATPADAPEQPTSSTLQRALACALECAMLEHKEAGACLRLKVAVACGAAFVAEVGKAERWELFVGGAALHDLGRAAHDMPVGGVVVAQSAWPAAKAFALGAVLASGDVLVSGLRVASVAPDAELALESERIYDQARTRSDVGAAVAHYVPLSARLRLSELSAAHLSDYRELSILFCSLLSFEKHSESLATLQSVCFVTLDVLERYRGSLRQFLHEDKGVTIIALFGLPGSNFTDDATRAVRAARRLHHELHKLGIAAAIGLATGRTFCGTVGSRTRHEYAAVGPKVNLSARLMQAAADRTPPILCDAATREAAAEDFSFIACEPIHVKGKEEAVPVFLPGDKNRSPSTRRPIGKPLFGRDAEWRAFQAVVERVQITGEGHAVVLKGYPGTGKTTLVQHMSEHLCLHTSSTMCRESGHGSAYGVVYRLFNSLLHSRHLFRAQGDNNVADKKHAIQEVVQMIVCAQRAALTPYLPLLNNLLNVSFAETDAAVLTQGAQRTERVHELLSVVLDRLVYHPPKGDAAVPSTFLLVINNFESCDESSALFLRHWVTRPHTPRVVLVLATAAVFPEEWAFLPDAVRAAYLPCERFTHITMSELSVEDILMVVAEDWGKPVDQLPARLKTLLKERALGNPLAAVSFAALLRDEGGAVEVAPALESAYSLTRVGEVSIPSNVFRLIAHEFDRLPPRVSNTLCVASLIGREFSLALLQAALGADTSDKNLAADLALLEAHMFIKKEGVADDDSTLYTFAYTLIADVAAQIVSFSARKGYHLRIASRLAARLKPADPPAAEALIGHHLLAAERWAEGVRHSAVAANAYFTNYVVPEGVSLYRRMIAVCKEHPEAAPMEEVLSFYQRASVLMNCSLDRHDIREGLSLKTEALAFAGKRVLRGEEAKAAVPAIKAQLIRRLDRSKYFGKGANKALSLVICSLADSLLTFHLLSDPNPDGYMHFGLFATLLEAAEDAGDVPYCIWVYSHARALLQAVPHSVPSLYRVRLPKIYAHFAEVDTQNHPDLTGDYGQLMAIMRLTFSDSDFIQIFPRIHHFMESFSIGCIQGERGFQAMLFLRMWMQGVQAGRLAIELGNRIHSQPEGQRVAVWADMGRSLVIEGHLMEGDFVAAAAAIGAYESLRMGRLTPNLRFAQLTRRLHLHYCTGRLDAEFCAILKEAWSLVPAISVRLPQLYYLDLLLFATFEAAVSAAKLPDASVVADAAQQVEELLNRMWALVGVVSAVRTFMWTLQGLYFLVFDRNAKKADVCFRKADAFAAKHIPPFKRARLLVERAPFLPQEEQRAAYEQAIRWLASAQGADSFALRQAHERLARLTSVTPAAASDHPAIV